jgi:hypothetical protein
MRVLFDECSCQTHVGSVPSLEAQEGRPVIRIGEGAGPLFVRESLKAPFWHEACTGVVPDSENVAPESNSVVQDS